MVLLALVREILPTANDAYHSIEQTSKSWLRQLSSTAHVKCSASMSCMLRVGGGNFNADSFIASVPLPIDSLWRKGEKRFPNSTTNEQINESSGIRIVVSEASFYEFPQQIEDVISFLQTNLENVKRLSSFPGIEWLVLDFGAEIYPPGWSSFTFPPTLLSLSGQAGISLCLSVYPTENEAGTNA